MIVKTTSKEFPKNAHISDTGYDLIATSEPKIVGDLYGWDMYRSVQYIEYDTGLKVEPEFYDTGNRGEPIKYGYLQLFPRSSISKYNLILANSVGIVDNGYRDTIKLRFKYIFQPEDMRYFNENGQIVSYGAVNKSKIYQMGDKCGQLVAAWKETIQWETVDKLQEAPRDLKGFGGTGK